MSRNILPPLFPDAGRSTSDVTTISHRRRPVLAACLGLAFLAGSAVSAWASPFEPADEDRLVTDHGGLTQNYDLVWLSSGETPDAAMGADLDYALGMQHHHMGAVVMAEDYLADREARNPILRRLAGGIIANQIFEIAILEDTARRIARGPRTLFTVGDQRLVLVRQGFDGWEHQAPFIRTPAPTLLEATITPGPVNARDVRFAREMIRHHGAAMEQAGAYIVAEDGRNLPLSRLSRGIIAEQAYEIVLMQAIVDAYGGDADAVPLMMTTTTLKPEAELIEAARRYRTPGSTGLPSAEATAAIGAMPGHGTMRMTMGGEDMMMGGHGSGPMRPATTEAATFAELMRAARNGELGGGREMRAMMSGMRPMPGHDGMPGMDHSM
ncbi:DUF305 domain-containing protein [Marinivivus vitaminiproducens]|uniref:DUF305 domain-containing protein n=1 Tax=Marinivivus vitaminiproducens TaxID=3035935 RepID=UPI00279A7431|nr:DUF305 domain-containing protein [Geminicoccaceae bacterium SCSIO 64248]